MIFFVILQQLRKRLQSLGLKPVKIKLLPRQQYCFVTFRNEEERQVRLYKVACLLPSLSLSLSLLLFLLFLLDSIKYCYWTRVEKKNIKSFSKLL